MRFVFDEFGNRVVVSFSGGKDSTVILELALIVARERNLLPLRVLWLDQESEWTETVNYCKRTMYREEVKPYWFQIPFKLTNASSFTDNYLNCWFPEEKDKWIREQDPISYKESPVKHNGRWSDVIVKVTDSVFPRGIPYAVLYGLKTNESLNRKMALTSRVGYGNTTWSTSVYGNPKAWKFAPIYDWSDADVWTAIGKFGWDYNKVYDEFFRYGESPSKMRVSSLIHESSSYQNLLKVQEIDPPFYEALCNRLQGVSTYSNMMEGVRVHSIPSAFGSWAEYRDYLIENLIPERNKSIFYELINSEAYKRISDTENIDAEACNIILSADVMGVKFGNLLAQVNKNKAEGNGEYRKRYVIDVEEEEVEQRAEEEPDRVSETN